MDVTTSMFPEVQQGGSLMLAWQVRGRRVLVIGGGEVAAGRIYNLLCADAEVTVVCPRTGLNEEVAYRISQGVIKHVDRDFDAEADLEDPELNMVLTAVDDPAVSSTIYNLCKARSIPANIADVPSECDFYFGSVHRDGPLQIMVSTNGYGPKLASIVRKQIAADLPYNTGSAIQKVGILRKKLRVFAPTSNESPKRMGWMSRVCEKWSLAELCEMSERDMEALLGFYGENAVPSFSDIRPEDETDQSAFDGSFGWSCVI